MIAKCSERKFTELIYEEEGVREYTEWKFLNYNEFKDGGGLISSSNAVRLTNEGKILPFEQRMTKELFEQRIKEQRGCESVIWIEEEKKQTTLLGW